MKFGFTSDEGSPISRRELERAVSESYPRIWDRYNCKIIDNPGSHLGFRCLALSIMNSYVDIAQFAAGETSGKYAFSSVGMLVADLLESHNFPCYYVSKNLLQSLQHTSPPKGMTWKDLKLPFPAATFFIPLNHLFESRDVSLGYVGYAWAPANYSFRVPGTTIDVTSRPQDRLITFYGIDRIKGNESTIKQLTVLDPEQELEPSPEWIIKTTEESRKRLQAQMNSEKLTPQAFGDPNYSSYITGLIANLILIMQARPEYVETSDKVVRITKHGKSILSPNFIGRNYQIKQMDRTDPQGHYTELGWRCGHYRNQPVGPGRSETRLIWIDPYIAHTHGFKKEEMK